MMSRPVFEQTVLMLSERPVAQHSEAEHEHEGRPRADTGALLGVFWHQMTCPVNGRGRLERNKVKPLDGGRREREPTDGVTERSTKAEGGERLKER